MTTKKKPASRAQAKPSSTTTAIARIQRTASAALRTVTRRMEAFQVPSPAAVVDVNTLGEDATLGALGLVEVKLTAKEEEILSRPVNVEDILIKPTGQPYLSHPAYTKWFNEAFGRLGWMLVPRSKPLRQVDGRKIQVVCPYILYIHGTPAAFAMGEHEFFDNNAEQSYGDALEATVASALRRCAKRLGVGLELWDKKFLDDFMETRCVKVWRGEDTRPSWRLKDAAPFWNERERTDRDDERGSQDRQHQPRRPSVPLAGSDGRGGQVISEKQLGRLWTIARRTKRTDAEVHSWLKRRYNLEHSRDIPRGRYDEICNWLEQRGPLPEE